MDANVSPSPIKFHYPYGRVGVVADPIEETWLFDSPDMRWPASEDIEIQERHATHFGLPKLQDLPQKPRYRK